MIIALLKDEKLDKYRGPAVSGDKRKFFAKADEIIFELKLEKGEKDTSKPEFHISEPQNKLYFFNQSDIIAQFEINDQRLLIVSGDIKSK